MFGNKEKALKRKKATIAFLIRMIGADGKIERVERKFVLNVGKQLKISPAELDEIEQNLDQYDLSPPQNEQ